MWFLKGYEHQSCFQVNQILILLTFISLPLKAFQNIP